MDPSAYKVLILRFNGDTEPDQAFGKKIAGALRTSFERYLEQESQTKEGKRAGITPEQFEVRLVGCSVPSHKDARRIGLAWGADLVLWGTASCSLNTPQDCHTINIIDSTVTTGRDANFGGAAFHGEYVPSATLIGSLPLQVSSEAGVAVVSTESASMVEWDFPRVATPEPLALLNMMIGLEAFSRPDYVSAARYLQLAEEDLEVSSAAAQNVLEAMSFAYLRAGIPAKARERAERRVNACGEEPKCLSTALTDLGRVSATLGDHKQALVYYEQAMTLMLRKGADAAEIAKALNGIGTALSALGEIRLALSNLERALVLREKLGDHRGEASTLVNIGLIWFRCGDKDRAKDYFDRALGLFHRAGDMHGEAATVNNIGRIASALGYKQSAIEYYESALSIMRLVGDVRGEATILHNIALVYLSLGDNKVSLEFFDQALPLMRQVGDMRGEASTLYGISDVWRSIGDRELAMEYYHQALSISHLVGDVAGEDFAPANTDLNLPEFLRNQPVTRSFEQASSITPLLYRMSGEVMTLNNLGLTGGPSEEVGALLHYDLLKSHDWREGQHNTPKLIEVCDDEIGDDPLMYGDERGLGSAYVFYGPMTW